MDKKTCPKRRMLQNPTNIKNTKLNQKLEKCDSGKCQIDKY